MIARAHQLVQEGFKYMFDESLVTVWSAPNYCYRCGNSASILQVDEDGSKKFKVYEAAAENNTDQKNPALRRLVRLLALISAASTSSLPFMVSRRARTSKLALLASSRGTSPPPATPPPLSPISTSCLSLSLRSNIASNADGALFRAHHHTLYNMHCITSSPPPVSASSFARRHSAPRFPAAE